MERRFLFVLAVVSILLGTATAQSASFGRTPGKFGVSSSGSAQYSFPVWTPPGIGSLQQAVSLYYNSQGGEGLVGVGWSVSGLSSISRCNLTVAQDSVAGSPQLSTTDRLCLDGKKLRLTSSDVLSTYGQAGTTYQTEIADFSNITAMGSAGNGPAYFTVQGKNGLTYEYGNTTDSQILAGGGAQPSVRTWALDKISDRAGNSIHFSYVNDTSNGTYRISDIYYPYTSAGSGPFYDIHFTYAARPANDILTRYVVGYAATETQRLSEIDVQYQNSGWQLERKYVLTYTSGPSNRSQLQQIQECGPTDCLLATTMTYQNGTAGVGSEVSTGQTIADYPGALLIDMNGDGKTDLVYPDVSSGHYFVMLGSATGFAAPSDTGVSSTNYLSALPIDYNSDGKMDLLIPNSSGNWRVLQSLGATFSINDTSIPATGAGGNAWVADIDGDGRPDLLYSPNPTVPGSVLMARYNSVSGFSTTATQVYQLGSDEQFGNSTTGSAFYPVALFTRLTLTDFDGDGRADIVVRYRISLADMGNGPPYEAGIRVLLSRGNSFVLGYDTGAFQSPYWSTPVIADFNSDGLADMTYGRNGQTLQVLFGSGTGVVHANTSLTTGLTAFALDWDGDGRSDLIYEAQSGSNFDWFYAISTGTGFNAGVDTGIVCPASNAAPYIADINGDGLADWVYFDTSNVAKIRLHPGAQGDLATAFTDGYGVASQPSYASMAVSGYTKGTGQVFPQQDYTGTSQLVQSVSQSDGIGGTYSMSYTYSGAVVNLQGRGFQGIGKVTFQDSRNGFYDSQYFYTSFPSVGMLRNHILTQSTASKNVRSTAYTESTETLDSTANNQRVFPYYSSINDQSYELGGTLDGQLITTTVTTNSTPDAYGNFATVASTVTDNDPNSPYLNKTWTTSSAYTVSPDHGSNWCLSLPTEVDVTNTVPPGSGSQYVITRHTTFVAPDYTHCRQTEQVIETGNATFQVDTKLYYDTFGNLNSQTVTGAGGMAARTTGINWGTSGQFPTSQTNALSQTTQFSFDPTSGQPLSVTDPNGIKTQWTYDAFARKIKELRPDGTSTTWAYNSCASAGCVNSNNQMTVVQTNVNSNSTTLNIANTYLDTFDRVLVTSKQMYNGAYDRNEVQYDNLNNVHLQLAPCTFVSCTQYWTTNTYDYLNRLTASQRPVNAINGSGTQTTSITYAGRTTTTTDPNNAVSSVITQVTGQIGRTKDANGYYVTFDYDAFGSQLSAKDSLSNTLKSMTYTYGIRSFPQTSTDIDMGSKTYTYDALGELTAFTDAKGQSFSSTYDALSRPQIRTEPDPAGTFTTTWTWGTTAANDNIGKLASIQSAASAGTYSESYGYDSTGRLSSETIATPGAGSNRFDYAYSSTTGLLSTLTYPASYPSTYRLAVSYTYEYGILWNLTDANVPSTSWWHFTTTNPRGQITAQATSDSSTDPALHESAGYDAVTGWVSYIHAGAGNGSGTALQNENYLYDKLGNVTQRQDSNAGLTENFYYDNLYRLDHSTLIAGSNPAVTNLQMCYDNTGGSCTPNQAGMGNITSRSDVAGGAAWTYDPTHIHQVTQAGSASFTYAYDANGNAKTRNGVTVGWTSYNYPSSVGTSTESATFDYGPNRARWHMAYSGPSGVENTYYATPEFEIVITPAGTDYRHYIYAYGAPKVAISRTNAGAVTVRSLLTNHQGSIASIITSSTGTNLVSESFTAYGSRREASTWSGSPTTSELTSMNSVTREGYTFQTVLGSMGLNHMNGRIEDSVTGRFLSADPVIPNFLSTQDFNRYSYTDNNPLSYIDPTGFDGGCDSSDDADCNAPACSDDNCTTVYAPRLPANGTFMSLANAANIASIAFQRSISESQVTTRNVLAASGLTDIDSILVTASVDGDTAGGLAPGVAGGGPNQARGKHSICANIGEVVAGTLAGAAAGGAGGAVAGTEAAPGVGSVALGIAGAVGGGVTGLVTGLLGVAGSPVGFSAGVGAPLGYVSGAFAGEAFGGGATLGGSLAGAAGGAIGALPGATGAALGGGVGAYAGGATALAIAAPIATGVVFGGATYLGVKAIANAVCGPE